LQYICLLFRLFVCLFVFVLFLFCFVFFVMFCLFVVFYFCFVFCFVFCFLFCIVLNIFLCKALLYFIFASKSLRSPLCYGWPLWNICVTNHHGDVPIVTNTSRSFPYSRLITGFVTRLTRRVPLVEQELLILPEHPSSPSILSGVRVTWSLVLCVCFVDRCLSFCTFSFGHCFVCTSSIYGFWLPFWYLQTLLEIYFSLNREKKRFRFVCVVSLTLVNCWCITYNSLSESIKAWTVKT